MQKLKILILSVPHGAGHQRAANALAKALHEIERDAGVEVVDALSYCAPWFRRYYNSYEILVRYAPRLWDWIDNVQYQQSSTGPSWLYRRGGRPLFRFLEERDPDVVIATEVGMCELAALHKREGRARFRLVGVCLMDMDRAWAQPEVDLYPVAGGDLASQLERGGVPASKIVACGTPIDPCFADLPDRAAIRKQFGVDPEVPLVLVLFGGTGFGRPRQILDQLGRVTRPLEAVFITGKNSRLEAETRSLMGGQPRRRILGWVDNMHEWMTASDLLLSKPAGMTVFEALACGLPILAFDPLPGNEVRNCALIEKWKVGTWVRRPEDLAPVVERLVGNPKELRSLRERAFALAQPRAAFDAAAAILNLPKSRALGT